MLTKGGVHVVGQVPVLVRVQEEGVGEPVRGDGPAGGGGGEDPAAAVRADQTFEGVVCNALQSVALGDLRITAGGDGIDGEKEGLFPLSTGGQAAREETEAQQCRDPFFPHEISPFRPPYFTIGQRQIEMVKIAMYNGEIENQIRGGRYELLNVDQPDDPA